MKWSTENKVRFGFGAPLALMLTSGRRRRFVHPAFAPHLRCGDAIRTGAAIQGLPLRAGDC